MDDSLEPLRRGQETAYMAGFFDGEGCIMVNRGQTLRLTVGQITPEPLKVFQRRYGGAINEVDRRTLGTRYFYSWELSHGPRIREALGEMLPFLLVKQEEAETALQFLDTFNENYQRVGVPVEVRELRADLDRRLRFLKARDYAPETLAARVVEDYFADSDLIRERSSAQEGMAL